MPIKKCDWLINSLCDLCIMQTSWRKRSDEVTEIVILLCCKLEIKYNSAAFDGLTSVINDIINIYVNCE